MIWSIVMPSLYQTIDLYENEGSALTLGSGQVLSFTNFQNSVSGHTRVEDDNSDFQWDLNETGEFNGQAAEFVAAGTAVAGVDVDLLGVPITTITLSSPVNVGVIEVDGVQYIRFFNEDGTEAEPAALLDALASQLVTALTPFALLPGVQDIIDNSLDYVENNAFLIFDLSETSGIDMVTCFTAGTLVVTERGEVAVETLKIGDRVLTVDHGLQPIRWIGSRIMTVDELGQAPQFRPIRIEAGALGDDLPLQRLTVSPQHRCLVRSKIAERMSGDREVLVAAKHLLGLPGVEIVEAKEPVTYIHMLFDRHELLWSNGAITESFYLGEQALSSVDRAAREEILALFPSLADGLPDQRPVPARPFLRGRVARKLVDRSVTNRKPMVESSPAAAKHQATAAR
jgi:hypothetical protein